jgi:WD40 repeat protein
VVRGQTHWPVAISPNGESLIVAAGDATLNLVEVSTGHVTRVLAGHRDRVRAVTLAPDGSTAVSAADDRTIRVWSLGADEGALVIQTGRHWIRELRVTPDSRYVLSASEDRTLKLWDLSTGAEIRTFQRHDARVNAVVVAGDRVVVSGAGDGTVRVWRLDDASLVKAFKEHEASVNAIALHTHAATFVTAASDFTVKVWTLGADRSLCTYSGEAPMTACAIGCDNTIIVGDLSGRVHFLYCELASEGSVSV